MAKKDETHHIRQHELDAIESIETDDSPEERFANIRKTIDKFMAESHHHDGIGDWYVHEFIRKFRTRWAGDMENFQEVLIANFVGGYCLMFARILQMTFNNRGTIGLMYPYSHVVWKDRDNILWDIRGRYRDDGEDSYPSIFIPISYVPDCGITALEHLTDTDDEVDHGNWELTTFMQWSNDNPEESRRYRAIRDRWLIEKGPDSDFRRLKEAVQ